MRVDLAWPSRDLSPNGSHGHWAKTRDARRAAKTAAHWACLAAGFGAVEWHHQPKVRLTFCPPDRRARDLDNCIASAKALCDGVASAMGVDDSRWEIAFRFGEVVKGGSVVVEVE